MVPSVASVRDGVPLRNDGASAGDGDAFLIRWTPEVLRSTP